MRMRVAALDNGAAGQLPFEQPPPLTEDLSPLYRHQYLPPQVSRRTAAPMSLVFTVHDTGTKNGVTDLMRN